MKDWQEVGPHRYWVEGDRLFWQSHGALFLQHMETHVQCVLAIIETTGHAYVCIDQTNQLPFLPAARKAWITGLHQHVGKFSSAFFGGSTVTRVVDRLMFRALHLVFGNTADVHVANSESDAWACLEQARAQRRLPHLHTPFRP